MTWQCALLGLLAIVIAGCALIVALSERRTHPDDELRAVCTPKITRAWLRALREKSK